MTKFYDQFNKDQLINEFKSVVFDAEALLKATANTSGDKIAEVRAKAEKSLNIAKAKLADAQDEMLAKTKAAAKVTDVYVHENPWRSIGLAASVGVVIGLLIGRR
ncbi:MAG: YqjD family protein [Methylotenera sp.]|nr:YqjD family protein [Methylotenera sp.]